jgi:glycosyltransferase involved in cell wall biosynthesis
MIPLSIIIPAWNEAPVIGQTLRHILDVDYDKTQLEVIVVAGGTDKTFEIATGLTERMQAVSRYLVLKQKPAGKNAAIQQGVKEVRHSVIVLLDGDTSLTRNSIKQLVLPLEQQRCDLAIANPIPVRRTWVSEYYMISKEYYLQQITSYPGTAMALRTELIREKLDYFFQTNVKVGVDYLLAKRLQKEGGRVLFVPQAKVVTWIPSSLKHFYLNDLRWLTAYIALDGLKWSALGMNIGILVAIGFLIPFSTWSFTLGVLTHAAYVCKKGHVFWTVLRHGRTKLGYFPGFLVLSYLHHLIGLMAHIRYFSGSGSHLTLRQGQRPTA